MNSPGSALRPPDHAAPIGARQGVTPKPCGCALAKVLRKQEDWQGAIEVLETLVSSAPAKDEDYLSLARCYELGPRDLPKAVEIVSRAVYRHEAAGNEIPECLLRRKRRLERAMARLQSRSQSP